MSLKDPRAYGSRELMWFGTFHRRRVAELAPLITNDLLAELARNPKGRLGDQSEALSQVLNFVRNETPMAGRAFVYVETPGVSYRLARMRGRGAAPDLADPPYGSEDEAVVAVIRERLEVLGLMPAKAVSQ